MKVAIIIPTKNEEKFLPHLLKSLKEQTFKTFTLYVADANSNDKTVKIAKRFGANIVKGGIPAVARDNGAREAIKEGHSLLIFIDADVILPNKKFLEASIKEFENRGLDVATALHISYDSKSKRKPARDIRAKFVSGGLNTLIKIAEKSKSPLMLAFMISKSEVHQKIGGFGNAEYKEDSDYAKKAVSQGYKFGVLKDVGKFFFSMRRFEKKGYLRELLLILSLNIRKTFGNPLLAGEKKWYFD